MKKRLSVKGFSLVELMISLALGSVVTAGVVQLFVANSETHNLLIGQSRMQESARFALDFIGREIRQAGYRGCFSANDDLYTSITPDTDIPYEFDLRAGIQGFESTGLDTWSPVLTTLLPDTATDLPLANAANSVYKTSYNYGAGSGINLSQVITGTDLVTFRHISQTDARVGGYIDGGIQYGPMPTSAEPMVVGINDGWDEFDQGHLAMIHDCEKATIFRVTTANPWGRNADGSPKAATADLDLTVGHDLDTSDNPDNSFLELALVNSFDTDAAVSAIESHTFFIAPGAGLNRSGNNPLSLWRKSGLGRPIELVEGVENLQILYGVDTDEDDVPNQYVAANFVPDWGNIATMRITVVVNSVDDVGSTSSPTQGCTVQQCVTGEAYDGLIRRSFSQTILLRN